MLTAAFCLILAPFVWSIGPDIEMRYFPVVRNVAVQKEDVTSQGVEITMTYDKSRPCEIVDLVWENGLSRLPVEPAEGSPLIQRRTVGEDRQSRVLLIRGTRTLEGTRAIVFHRCHPLWLSRSLFYP